MERINNAISQYQQKIGKFDRQAWEQSVEQEVLKRLRSVPKKTAKVNPDLIDVDLFGGSAFCKAKPHYGWLAVSRRAILRVIFFPLYQKWWRSSTSGWVFTILCLLYVLQVTSLLVCLTDPGQSLSAEMLSMAHMASPCVIMFVIAMVHSQIMAACELSSAHYSQMQAKNKKNKTRCSKRKAKLANGGSGRESVGSHDTGIYLNPDDIDSPLSVSHRNSAAGLYSVQTPVSHVNSVDGTDKQNDVRCSHRRSSLSRRTSIEKTSAWLQQQAPKQLDSNNKDIKSCDVPVNKILDRSSAVLLDDDKYHDVVSSSRSEPTVGSQTLDAHMKLPSKTSDLSGLIQSSRSDECSGAVISSSSNICSKPRQLRFSCIVPDCDSNGWPSDAACGQADLLESRFVNCQNNDEAAEDVEKSERLHESSHATVMHGCSASSSMNDVEDGSPQDDAVSIANSNTSISDTCNSSLKSSTEDLVRTRHRKQQTVDGSPVGYLSGFCNHFQPSPVHHQHHHHHSHSHCHSHYHQHHLQRNLTQNFGIRHRKRSNQDCVSTRSQHSAKHHSSELIAAEVADSEAAELDPDLLISPSAFPRDAACHTNMSSPNDSPSAPASTDEEGSPVLRVSPSIGWQGHHGRASRKTTSSARSSLRLGDKCNCCRQSTSKERKDGSCHSGGHVSSMKMDDVRLLESTGISSGDSDGECGNKKVKATSSSKKYRHTGVLTRDMLDPRTTNYIGTSEWDDTVNTEMTSGSVSETSSQHSSCNSDISEKDLLGNDNNATGGQAIQHASSVINSLASNADRVSCMIWEPNAVHKVDMTVLDIGWTIIQKVDKMPETCDYLVLGIVFSIVMMFIPTIYRIYHSRDQLESLNYHEFAEIYTAAKMAFGHNWRQVVVILNGMVQRLWLSLIAFFLLSVGERTFKQRLMYAKNFCYLTSSRRAKKYELPHFRLNKVRNIKTWLSLRSFLKKRGPQRTVEIIVSAAFLLAIILVSILCIELLQDYGTFLDHLGNWELVMWCMCLGVYLLRFITLGTKINKKYRNFSVLITEQINLYLHMEQKPHKKEELMVANNVLKLAEDLLKELESPFKISGLSANPFLYNITKVVVLSAFSAVLTELLGFKLKLYKIKMRA